MAEIIRMDFGRFLQNQDFALHGLIIPEVEKLTDEQVTGKVATYREKFTSFDESLKVGGKSPYSKQLAESDKVRDSIYNGMAAQVNVMLNHFDKQKADVAYLAKVILDKYGNPTKLPYLQEDAVLKNLIADLRVLDNKTPDEPEEDEPVVQSTGEARDLLLVIGIREWLDQLEAANNAFMAIYAERNAADATVVTGATKASREACDLAADAVFRRINALAELYGDADYIDVINNVNQLIEKEKAELAHHKAMVAARKKKNEEGNTPSPDTPEDDAPVVTNE